MDEARLERDTLQKELEVVHTKVNENQKILDKIKSEKRDKAKSNENTKQVSPLELHEYESINETCSKRLDEKKKNEPIRTPEYMERLQAQRDTYRKAFEKAKEAAEQRKRLRKTQGDRVKEEEGIESDSDEEEEDQVVVSTEAHNKRGGKPGSRGQGRGGRHSFFRSCVVILRGSWVDRAVGRSARYGEVESVLALVTSSDSPV
ncbi:12316_t:CDS:2 [Rhizophagus irregularis]|nr:12316_t:CDS:2 [Rhizophagus irregularis]